MGHLFKSGSLVAWSVLLLSVHAAPPALPPAGALVTAKLEKQAQPLEGVRIAPGLVATVVPAGEAGPGTVSVAGGAGTPATVMLLHVKSRLTLLKVEAAATEVVRTGPSLLLKPGEELFQTTNGGWTAVRYAGRVKSMHGNVLPLALLSLNVPAGQLQPGRALFNAAGEVVALELMEDPDSPGAAYAVPIEAALKVAHDFEKQATVETGDLSLTLEAGSTVPRIVEDPAAGTRAADAGVKAGDVILQLGGRPTLDTNDVVDANFYLNTKEPVMLKVLRGLQELTLTAPGREK